MDQDLDRPTVTQTWALTYFGLALGFAFVLLWLLFAETELATAAKLIFLAVFVLTLRCWTGAVLFAICQLQLLMHEPRSDIPLFSLSALMWSGLSLGMLIVVSRYRTLQDRETDSTHRSFFAMFRDSINGKAPNVDGQQVSSVFRQLVKCTATILVCSMIAWGILCWLPPTASPEAINSIREFRITPGGYRLLVCSLLLFCWFYVAWLLVNEFCWRKLNAHQSRIYLHSVLLKFLDRDFRSVAKRRLKLRRKKIKTPHPNGDIPIID